MKKLSALLLVVLLSVCLTAVCYAATGEELLKNAEMYLTFEDTYNDTMGKMNVEVDGDDPEFVEGRFGKGIAIRSGEGALYTEDLKFETNSFTISCWVNVHEHSSDPCLFANKDWNSGANAGFLLAIRDSDWKYNANCDGGTRTDTEYPYDIAGIGSMEDQWYHVAMVVDRETQWYCLYINGNPLNKGTSFADKGHEGVNYDDEWNEYPFYIGEDGTGLYNMSKTLNFEVDEFAVFFSALSPEDVVAVYTYAPEGYEGATLAEAKDLHIPLPEFTVDPAAVLDSADVYLSFDDGVADAKGHAVRQEGEIETVDGIAGKAVRIDSDKGHLALDDYKFGTDSFTVTAWIYGESASSDPCLFSNKDWDSSSNPGWLISQKGENWRYAANAAGFEKVDKTFSYALMPEDAFSINGQWYHMALVVDRAAQTLNLYINGRPYFEPVAFEVDHTDASYDTEYPFVIGEDGPEKYTTNADDCTLVNLYDEIAIFKRALTGEEVAALYSINMKEEAAAEAPAAEEPAAEEPAAEEPAAPTYTYPASGAEGSLITGTVIGNATGWGDNADAGAAAAFDGNPGSFFDPLGVGDGFCGIDAGESYILDKVVILSRDGWNDRFVGAMIQGSNDGENWTTLWTSGETGTNPDYYTVTEFENNTGYSQFRYFNETNHGDVAEVEFYGTAGSAAEEAPAAESKGFADVNAAADGKNVITAYTFTEGTNGFGGEGADNLFDGDTATKFCTNEFPAEAIASLDGVYKVTGFTMATANDNADWNGRSPNAWTISVSADGENWTELASGDDTFFEETNFTYYVGDASAEGVSYVKFSAAGTASGTFQVSELTLFGDKTADAAEAAAETPEAVDEAMDDKAEAPQTFDFGIVAAAAALVSLAGFALSRKNH